MEPSLGAHDLYIHICIGYRSSYKSFVFCQLYRYSTKVKFCMAETKKHFRVCNLCEAMCGLEIEHDGQKVISVKGDENDPFSKGSLCPKGALIHKLHEDPDRLKTPLLKNKNGEWEEIGWEEAFDIVGEKINDIRKQYGNDAIALYFGNPTVHNLGAMLFSGEIKRSLKTKNFFTATSMDQLPHHFVGYHVLGHSLNLPIPDVNRTDYFIMFGANPMVSNGSLMSGCGPAEKIKSIQDRGGKVILFDPRATETSRVVNEHYYICLLYTSPSPRDRTRSRMPSSA